MKNLIATLDDLGSNDLTSMTRAQYKLQRHWIQNPQENVPDSTIMFACLPGLAGIPHPDGGMSLWFPIVHMVCQAVNGSCDTYIFI